MPNIVIRTPRWLACALCAGLLALASGCPSQPAPPAAEETTAAPSEAEKIEAAIAQLPQEDQEAARQQKICPVSGEPLGSMGTPQKVEVNGQTVFICCSGCEEPLKEDPDKYLAKLNQ